MTAVAWFTRDIRIASNPIIGGAAAAGEVVALFVIDPELFDRVTHRRRQVLLAGLHALDRALAERGGRLRVEWGDPVTVVPEIAREVGAVSVHVNLDVTPYAVERQRRVGDRVRLALHGGNFVHPPGAVTNTAGAPLLMQRSAHSRDAFSPLALDAPHEASLIQPVIGPAAAAATVIQVIAK